MRFVGETCDKTTAVPSSHPPLYLRLPILILLLRLLCFGFVSKLIFYDCSFNFYCTTISLAGAGSGSGLAVFLYWFTHISCHNSGWWFIYCTIGKGRSETFCYWICGYKNKHRVQQREGACIGLTCYCDAFVLLFPSPRR